MLQRSRSSSIPCLEARSSHNAQPAAPCCANSLCSEWHFFFPPLHTLPMLLGMKGQLYCGGRVTTRITSTLHWFWMWKPEWWERKSRPHPISQRNCSGSLCCADSCSYVPLQISACQKKWSTPTLHFQALPWCLQTVPSENAELPCHSNSIIVSRKGSMERIKNISIFILYKLGILGL